MDIITTRFKNGITLDKVIKSNQMIYLLILIIVFVGLIIWHFHRESRYYAKLYHDDHYTEIANWVASVLQKGNIETPALDTGTAIVTSVGVALAYTREQDAEGDSLHFSVNLTDRLTTHSAAGRLIGFILILLNKNECQGTPFYTKSLVHHLVLTRADIAEWVVNPTDESILLMRDYQPLPFALQELGE
jgi:hypothetical protein